MLNSDLIELHITWVDSETDDPKERIKKTVLNKIKEKAIPTIQDHYSTMISEISGSEAARVEKAALDLFDQEEKISEF